MQVIIEIDLLEIRAWSDFNQHFENKYGFNNPAQGLPTWINELRRITRDETLFIIKNPMLTFGDNTNHYREILLQMIAVVNSERYAADEEPTIKVVFT